MMSYNEHDDADLIGALIALDRENSGISKHDRVIALIAACLASELREARRIIGVLRSLGFNARHVNIMLQENAGSDPATSWWRPDGLGRYRPHD